MLIKSHTYWSIYLEQLWSEYVWSIYYIVPISNITDPRILFSTSTGQPPIIPCCGDRATLKYDTPLVL